MIKKICLIKKDMSAPGGSERVAANLANILCDKYEVYLISLMAENGKSFYPLDDRVNFIFFTQTRTRLRQVLFNGIRKSVSIFRKKKFSVALAIGVDVFFVTAVAGLFSHTKTVACEHSNLKNTYHGYIPHRLFRFLGSKLCRRVVTLTKGDRLEYIKKYHLKDEKVVAIYNSIDDDVFEKPVTYDVMTKQIISVGRIDQVKGYDMLIDVAQLVFDKHPDWQWHIWGAQMDVVEAEKLKEEIVQKQLTEHVILKGLTTDIYDVYPCYAFLVLTSYYEGFPLVLVEALASKLPVVGFDCPTGPGEIIEDGINGYLIPCFQKELMADRICNLIESPKIRSNFSCAARGTLEKFRIKSILTKWVDFIENI